MASVMGSSAFEDSDSKSIKSSFQQILTSLPKTITKKNFKQLLHFLFENEFSDSEEFEEGVVSSLLGVIFNKNSKVLEQYLASNCLQQMAPLPDLCETAAVVQIGQLGPFLPVALIQGTQDKGFKNLKDKLLRYLQNEEVNMQYHSSIMGFLCQHLSNTSWNEGLDDAKSLSSVFVRWLNQQPNQTTPTKTMSRFRKPDVVEVVQEIDGTPSTEIFTALSFVEVQNAEQEINMYTFSILRTVIGALQPPTSSSGSSDLHSESLIDLSDELCHAVRRYCLRIIEQAERKPLVTSDLEIQKACLVEAINLLSLLCYANRNFVPSLLPSVRVLYETNILKKPTEQDVAVLTAAANFLIRHGGVIMHKMDDICPFLLKDVVGFCYRNCWASYEIITFVRENLNILCYQTSSLEKFFPSLLKILAWNPVCLAGDFQTLVPACMSSQTSVELFHSLLDLPCLTASLLIQQQMDVPAESNIDPALVKQVTQPSFQGMFSFILRPVSGMGDTFNKIQAYHAAIKPLAEHPLVLSCAETVIPILKSYFQVFSMFADTRLTSLLLPAMLERLGMIYEVPGYTQKVHQVLAEALLELIKDHPDVCTYLLEDFMGYISKEKNLFYSPEFYINLVGAIGEYANVTFSEICLPEVITSYYEGLECVVYELLHTCFEKQMLRFICVAITTLAKLSTSCQDLLQRAVLCLGKVGKQAMPQGVPEAAQLILIDRIRQLLALLQSPNLASQLLNPPKEIHSGRWHRNVTAESFMLKTVTSLVKADV